MEKAKGKKVHFKHSKRLTDNLMALICGRTGAGKTYLLFQMLTTPGILDYERIIILTSTPEQAYYQFLKHGFDNHLSKETINQSYNFYEESDEEEDIGALCLESRKYETNPSDIECILTDDPSAIKDPSKLSEKKNLIIFDDILTLKDQSIPQMMFTKGRHNKCACIYLAQSFYNIDKLIRKNANVFIVFETNDRNLTELLKDISVGDRGDFKQYAKNVWSENKYGYIVINLDKPLKKRYFIDIV